jgi:hypothetical protein
MEKEVVGIPQILDLNLRARPIGTLVDVQI